MKKKGSSEIIVRATMSLYYGAKMKVGVESELFEEFLMKLVHIKDLCCRHCFL